MEKHLFPWNWKLKNGFPALGIEYHGSKVFSCFACGGGSTMGYKLAGYDVIGFNEIDPKMAKCYITNFNPKYKIIKPIQKFKNYKKFPKSFYNLDILDGSPPCSNFSMAGNREKDWGKKKKFREGQQEQILDTLFFDFIDLAERLQPKIIIAENVKGLMMGGAKKYLSKIMIHFDKIGYACLFKLLDASKMGVPQRRERVFIIGIRKDLLKFVGTFDLFNEIPKLNLSFNEQKILFNDIKDTKGTEKGVSEQTKFLLKNMVPSDTCICDINQRLFKKLSRFNALIIKDNKICPTITSGEKNYRQCDKLSMTKNEYIKIGTFPKDYNFCNNDPKYIIGMSVPPVMIAQIANRIKKQWLNKIK